jgi:Phage integrase, N-terminal SAM-like domain
VGIEEEEGKRARGAAEWERALESKRWPAKRLAWFKFTIRWFLSFGRKQRPPLAPNRTTANYFYSRMVAEKRPAEWQERRWKEAIGFYLDRVEPKQGATLGGEGGEEVPWEQAFLRVARSRHLSYRTERSYLGWLKRYEKFAAGRKLRGIVDSEVRRFLSDLAVQERVSASTQKQAYGNGSFPRVN